MSLNKLREALPPYAADLSANLQALEQGRDLSPEERWGCLLACALASGEATTLRHVAEAAAEPLGERGVEAAKAAAAVTSMNDIYYGALGGLKNAEYATLPSGLRMDALAHPAADRDAFELWCLSVSTLDRCSPCMDAQDEELRRRGVPPARMQAAMRIAAVLGAVARVLAAEAGLQEDDAKGDGVEGNGEEKPDDAPPDGEAPAGGTSDTPAEAPAQPSTESSADPHPAGTADPATVSTPHPAPDALKITAG